jgi:GTP-binding protein
MLAFLADVGVPTLIVVTKIDKLSSHAVAERMRALASDLEIEEAQMIPFSAVTGVGRDELAGAIMELVHHAEA